MPHTPALVTFHCRKCRIALSYPVAKARGADAGAAHGRFCVPDGEWFDATGDDGFDRGVYVLHADDLTNWEYHPDRDRRIGCCGPSADLARPNLRCAGGHDVGGEQTDCHVPNGIVFDPRRVFLTDGSAPPLPDALAAGLAWAAARSAVVVPLAAGVAEDDTLAGLPVLADALEEAGLADGVVLDHLRGGHLHYGGCLVVDALLDLSGGTTIRPASGGS